MYTRVRGTKPTPWAFLVPLPWRPQVLARAAGAPQGVDAPDVFVQRIDEGSAIGAILVTLAAPEQDPVHYFQIAERHFALLRARGIWGAGSAVLGARGGGVIADCRLAHPASGATLRVAALSMSARGGLTVITNAYVEGAEPIRAANAGAVDAVVASAIFGPACDDGHAARRAEIKFTVDADAAVAAAAAAVPPRGGRGHA